MTVQEYADKYQLSSEMVRRKLRQGEIIGNKENNQWSITDNEATTTTLPTHNNTTTTLLPDHSKVEKLEKDNQQLEGIINNKDKSLELQDDIIGMLKASLAKKQSKIESLEQTITLLQKPFWLKLLDALLFRS
jgi:predicted RNase H-like nuclease (RuvC/YqgF family)